MKPTNIYSVQHTTAAVAGTSWCAPIRRIYCIGRNYADHAREMGSDPSREPPFFFTKFPDALSTNNAVVPYPAQTQSFHFEAELVVLLGRGGHAIPEEQALSHVFGYACGLDMTRRDLQTTARTEGRPWDAAKNFTAAAPLGIIHPQHDVGDLSSARVRLHHNGMLRQNARVDEMIWSPAEIIAHLSRFDTLAAGDLIFTGTPAGVGAVMPGDQLTVSIDGLSDLSITIGPPHIHPA